MTADELRPPIRNVDMRAVEIRLVTEGDCCCEPMFSREHTEPSHRCCLHWFECKFGRITNPAADSRQQIAHLMVTVASHAERLRVGRFHHKNGGFEWVTSQSIELPGGRTVERLYYHLATDVEPWLSIPDIQHGRWTWELHGAYFVNKRGDVRGPNHLMIGCWCD